MADTHDIVLQVPGDSTKPMDIEMNLPEPGGEKRAKREEYSATEHLMTFSQLTQKFGTQIDHAQPAKSAGISEALAADRLAKYGPNRLSPPPEVPEIIKFLRQFINGLMMLLEGAGVLCFIAYGLLASDDPTDAQTDWILGVVIFFIVVANCTMTYLQERQAGSVMEKFKHMLPAQV